MTTFYSASDVRLEVKKELIRLSRPGHEDAEGIGKLVLTHLGLFLEALRRAE